MKSDDKFQKYVTFKNDKKERVIIDLKKTIALDENLDLEKLLESNQYLMDQINSLSLDKYNAILIKILPQHVNFLVEGILIYLDNWRSLFDKDFNKVEKKDQKLAE